MGGQTATPGQFPYQTSMRTPQNGHFCGGFIINARWVGCAAHCTISRTPENTRVVVGAQNRLNGGITHTVSRIVNHESYSSITLINDISVVQTENPMVETALVRPIALGSSVVTSGGAVGSGWGQTSNPGSAAAELQFVPVSIISNEACRGRLSATQSLRIFESTICSSSDIGQGMCMGDSGGPLTQNGQVIGAVSWGVPCARGSPDMFARISSFRDWINQHVST